MYTVHAYVNHVPDQATGVVRGCTTCGENLDAGPCPPDCRAPSWNHWIKKPNKWYDLTKVCNSFSDAKLEIARVRSLRPGVLLAIRKHTA